MAQVKVRLTAQERADQAHRAWIREIVNLDDRHDSVPSLNGVAIGQWWQNRHSGFTEQVVEIRLAGLGAHEGHYESVMLGEFSFGGMGWALFSLADHWQLVEPTGYEFEAVEDAAGQMTFETKAVAQWTVVEDAPPFGDSRSWRDDEGCRCSVRFGRREAT